MSISAFVKSIYNSVTTPVANAVTNGIAGGTNPGLGVTVIRAAAADPQNVWQTIFTVAGGVVTVKAIIGERTIIQAGGASTMQFQHTVGPTVLDAGTGVVTGNGAGAIYWLTGDVTDPIQVADLFAPVMTGKIVATSVTHAPYLGLFLCGTGNIQVIMTAAAGTGSTRYTIIYVPITVGATIVAA